MDKIGTADFKTAEQTPVSRQLRLLIMTEFQHYNQKYIIFRILSYYSILLFQSLEEYRKGIAPYPLILPVVLVDLSGNRKWTAPNSTHELLPVTAPQTVRRCYPEFEFFVCNAADYAERELPETAGPAAQLMRLAAGKRAGTHKVQSILKQIIKLQRAGDHRFSRQIIADLFDNITQQPSLAYTILEAKTDQEASGIMDNVFDMIRAENLAELKAKDAVIAEKNAEIADKEAEIAGKEAEIASVKAENARHMAGLICTLRLQLQNFTDGSVPADIDARINAVQKSGDQNTLWSWIQFAIQHPCKEDILNCIRAYPSSAS